MNEPTSPLPSSSPSAPPTPAKRRINFGRRRSDWLVPLLFLAIAVGNAIWAFSNYLQRQDIEELKKGLEVQTGLRERQLRFYEKQAAIKAEATARAQSAGKATLPKPTLAPAQR